jgi:biopolymer transport protein ExbD
MILRKKKKADKINLIPIMDAVFIFIFFLLMSAQFVKIHEITAAVPAVKETKDDKEPLNLRVSIQDNEVTLTQGTSNRKIASYQIEKLDGMNEQILNLRKSYPEEHTATVVPNKTVEYKKIVKVIDIIRNSDSKGQKNGFSKIVFAGAK